MGKDFDFEDRTFWDILTNGSAPLLFGIEVIAGKFADQIEALVEKEIEDERKGIAAWIQRKLMTCGEVVRNRATGVEYKMLHPLDLKELTNTLKNGLSLKDGK